MDRKRNQNAMKQNITLTLHPSPKRRVLALQQYSSNNIVQQRMEGGGSGSGRRTRDRWAWEKLAEGNTMVEMMEGGARKVMIDGGYR